MKTIYRKILYLQEFTHAVMGNAGSNTWLVIADRYCHHGHALSERLKHCVQASMRNTQRCTLQQVKLRSRANNDYIRRNRPHAFEMNVLAHRKRDLDIR